MESWMAFVSGAAGAALVAGIFGLVQFLINRKDKKSEQDSNERKALRYLMLYIIQERAKEHLDAEKITLEDRRSLHHWHELYHGGLGGNGDADALMRAVDALPVDTGG